MAYTTEMNVNGVMTKVTRFDSSAQEIDDAAARAKYLSNPNLLDNWYFVNPVNQRGQTEYTGEGYTIDRWRKSTTSNNVIVETGGIKLVSTSATALNTAIQIMEFPKSLLGKQVTISALVEKWTNAFGACMILRFAKANGAFLTEFNCGISKTGLVQFTGTVPETYNGVAVENIQFVFRAPTTVGGEITIKAAKLELGSQQTLANQDENGNWVLNEIPNYAAELAKCQRYYIKYGALTSAIHVGYVQAVTTGQANGMIHLPVSLRANPTIVTENMPTIRLGVKDTVATKVSLNWVNNNNLYFAIEAAGLTVGETYVLRLNNATLAFDANL